MSSRKTQPGDQQPAGGRNQQGELLFGSGQLTAREMRRKVRQALQRGLEPEPKYSDGKSWRD